MSDKKDLLVLLSQNNFQTAPVLAQKLSVTTRTIYRWVDSLTEQGIPLSVVQGRNGGIKLDENFALENEADRLNLQIQKSFLEYIEVDFSMQEIEEKLDIKYDICMNAIKNCQTVKFVYKLSENKQLKCSCELIKFFLKDGKWNVLGFLQEAQKYKIFKLDAMSGLTLTEQTFKRHKNFNIKQMLNKK